MTEPTPSAALTNDQRVQFERDGYVVVEGAMTDRLDAIRSWLAELAADPDGTEASFTREELPEEELAGLEPLARMRKIGSLDSTEGARRHFGTDSPVAPPAADLAGSAHLRTIYLSAFAKPAEHGSATPWHQDQALWPQWMPDAVSGWVALDPSTRENGCLQFAVGSHRDGMAAHVADDSQPHQYLPDAAVDGYDVDYVEMDAGDVVFFGGQVAHRSDPNRSPNRRLGMPVVYCPDETWQRARENARWITNRLDVPDEHAFTGFNDGDGYETAPSVYVE